MRLDVGCMLPYGLRIDNVHDSISCQGNRLRLWYSQTFFKERFLFAMALSTKGLSRSKDYYRSPCSVVTPQIKHEGQGCGVMLSNSISSIDRDPFIVGMNLESFSKTLITWGWWAGGPISCSLIAALLRCSQESGPTHVAIGSPQDAAGLEKSA